MKAAILESGKKILDIREVPVPELKPGQVKVKSKPAEFADPMSIS